MNVIRKIATGLGIAVIAFPAWAGDEAARHDRRVEKAAAERAARKIGDLRGSFASDASLSALIEMDVRRRHPESDVKAEEAKDDALPPMVMNAFFELDPIVTGSNGR